MLLWFHHHQHFLPSVSTRCKKRRSTDVHLNLLRIASLIILLLVMSKLELTAAASGETCYENLAAAVGCLTV